MRILSVLWITRYRRDVSADWSVHVLSYNDCQSFAIEGQLTPDLKNDQEARELMKKKYEQIENEQWGLDQAETALITYFRPHFNKMKNIYPNPLQYTDY